MFSRGWNVCASVYGAVPGGCAMAADMDIISCVTSGLQQGSREPVSAPESGSVVATPA
jgi:hypothetical protein